LSYLFILVTLPYLDITISLKITYFLLKLSMNVAKLKNQMLQTLKKKLFKLIKTQKTGLKNFLNSFERF
jgi:hypothetical protein